MFDLRDAHGAQRKLLQVRQMLVIAGAKKPEGPALASLVQMC
jgi:hypothetical protein